jgi:predicted DNA-binding protein
MDKIVHIRLPEEVYKKFEKEAEETDRKISSLMRYVLIQWSKKEKDV